VKPGSARHRRTALVRFDLLEPYPRFVAWFHMKIDPMFRRLTNLVPSTGTVLDIGCGYGVQAAWLLALHPGLRFVGLEPDPEKARVARRVIGSNGLVLENSARYLPAEPQQVDAVLLLDVGHFIPDPDLERLLQDLHRRLIPGGCLLMRITVPTDRTRAWKRLREAVRLRFSRFPRFPRTPEQLTEQLARHGFTLRTIEDEGRDTYWFVACPAPSHGGPTA
jgi:SAM-dependent methyltransferase